MSEVTHHQLPESDQQNIHEYIERPQRNIESVPNNSEKSRGTLEKDVTEIRQALAQEAQPAHTERAVLDRLGTPEKTNTNTTALSESAKQQALYRLLKNVRQHLPIAQRGLSKVVHQPVVDTLSELTSRTVARPSGVLGGGLCALAGSLIFLYYAKHLGYSYNYLFFVVLFIGGYVIGTVLEIVIWTLRRRAQD